MLTTLIAAAIVGIPQEANYPPYIKDKELYAENDLRGKEAPKLVVETWMSGAAPKLEGKVVLYDFWATWCGPCRKSIPELNEWAEKFHRDLVVIGITDEPVGTVKGFMNSTAMKYPVAIDSEKRMSKQIGVRGIPHVLVVTPDGIVRWQGFPGAAEDKLDTKKLEQIIAAWKSSSKA
ncbi:TlpA disulfide reductase family protein [Kamptonema cortianum]|nr:TlpA disulfide reductase family protein [Geitlerinema splendidum]MDK3156330.1 TlpA disulfide reductase family protein [Kamptonema cortianum]